MASFLDNSGDIILDAVLTDYGRKLLAKGDGSFNIVKFALADDEIDYQKFDPEEASSYQDIKIMNTPILEAFTNNAASMKHTLITLKSENILFMPVLKLNAGGLIAYSTAGAAGGYFSGSFVVPVDTTSIDTLFYLKDDNGKYLDGVLVQDQRKAIVIEQGLDSSKLDQFKSLMQTDPTLYETEYNIYVDNHFCFVSNTSGNPLSYIGVDDDGIAVYKVSQQMTSNSRSFVTAIPTDSTSNTNNNSVIAGTKGSRLEFSIMPNNNLMASDYYFDKYGKIMRLNYTNAGHYFRTIRMPIKIVGVTTGCTIDITVIFAKYAYSW